MRSLKNLGLITLLTVTQWSCGSSHDYHSIIKNAGYIPYKMPLLDAGTGTLIGGKPESIAIVAHPQTCFPSYFNEASTNLRKYDSSNLPMIDNKVTLKGQAIPDLEKLLELNNEIQNVQSIQLKFTDVQVEYMDTIALTDFYNSSMSQICKEYLSAVGFIIQAIRVNKMEVKFYNSSQDELNLRELNFSKNSMNLSWHIDNNTTMVIDSPRYIAYQLGSIKNTDEGFLLTRANKVAYGKYIFQNLNIFNASEKIFNMTHDEKGLKFYYSLSEAKKLKVPSLNENLSVYETIEPFYGL
jgi:hypothetical protein